MKLTIFLLTVTVTVINSNGLDTLRKKLIDLLSHQEEKTLQNEDLENGFEPHEVQGVKSNKRFLQQTSDVSTEYMDDKHNLKDSQWGKEKSRLLKNFKSIDYRRKESEIPEVPEITRPKILDYNDSLSSSREMEDWRKEWDKLWQQKKYSVDQTAPPRYVDDRLVSWGKLCGDPNQNDMPSGTCVLDGECDAEDRIYRGDFFCGRTQFICCGIVVTVYDQILDMSDSDLTDDSIEEERKAEAKAKKVKKALRAKKRRAQMRYQRKKKIRKKIVRIIKEISRMLIRMYENSTKSASKRTKKLKNFIKMMKKKYKKDRLAVQDIFHSQMVDIDKALMERLIDIQNTNKEFMMNDTFRTIMINGTINRSGAKQLVEAYPDLYKFIPKLIRNRDILPSSDRLPERRSIGKGLPLEDTLEYDIENL